MKKQTQQPKKPNQLSQEISSVTSPERSKLSSEELEGVVGGAVQGGRRH